MNEQRSKRFSARGERRLAASLMGLEGESGLSIGKDFGKLISLSEIGSGNLPLVGHRGLEPRTNRL